MRVPAAKETSSSNIFLNVLSFRARVNIPIHASTATPKVAPRIHVISLIPWAIKDQDINIFITSKNEDTFIKSSNNALAKDQSASFKRI